MPTTLRFSSTKETLEAAYLLLGTNKPEGDVTKSSNLPAFSEWWREIINTNRNNLRVTTMFGKTNVRYTDYEKVIKPLLGNPALKKRDIDTNVGKTGLVESYVSLSRIRELAINHGICKA